MIETKEVKINRGQQRYSSMMKGTPKDVPPEVKTSTYGCPNCLWNGVECSRGSMYKEKKEGSKVFCDAYTYYD